MSDHPLLGSGWQTANQESRASGHAPVIADFCNKIGTQRTSRLTDEMSVTDPKRTRHRVPRVSPCRRLDAATDAAKRVSE